MAANLAPHGLLLFDLNTLLAYRTTFAADSVSARDGTDLRLAGRVAAPTPRRAAAPRAAIDVFAPRGDGLYERVERSPRAAPLPAPPRRSALLARAGLECLGVHGVLDDGSHVAEPDETRHLKVMYAARPAKGGDPE